MHAYAMKMTKILLLSMRMYSTFVIVLLVMGTIVIVLFQSVSVQQEKTKNSEKIIKIAHETNIWYF